MEYAAQPVEVARPDSTFLQRVFLWMFVGLAVTGGVAAAIGSDDQLLTDITESPGIIIGVIVVQLGIVFGISFLINRISVGLATVLFLIYSATVGVTFAFIFELYTSQSIFTTFLITSGMVGALAVWGAITDIDLSKVGSIAFMALIGLILATPRGARRSWDALALYLDFINLFLFLLRIFGRQR
jgi:FtsH-binding integral membrane protein